MTQPVKTKQVNTGTNDQPKFSTIGDYWDDQVVRKVIEVLHKYQDLFLTKFSKMNGIIGDLGFMKISLKPDAKTINKKPYQLNPMYREKVKIEIEKMLVA